MKQERNKKLCQVSQSGGPHQIITASTLAHRPAHKGQNDNLLPKNMETKQCSGAGAGGTLLILKVSSSYTGAMERGSLHFSGDCRGTAWPQCFLLPTFCPQISPCSIIYFSSVLSTAHSTASSIKTTLCPFLGVDVEVNKLRCWGGGPSSWFRVTTSSWGMVMSPDSSRPVLFP